MIDLYPLYLTRDDLTLESRNKPMSEISFLNIKYSLNEFKKAGIVILIDQEAREMKILKTKYSEVLNSFFFKVSCREIIF